MSFELNQIFDIDYPPEVAAWCALNSAFIAEIEPADGKRRFQIVAIPAPTPEEIEAQALAKAKAERAEAVENITVEIDGMVFDGNEDAMRRASCAILGLEDGEKMPWVLYDNTVAEVTKAQLKQMLRLAGAKMAELWVVPYEAKNG